MKILKFDILIRLSLVGSVSTEFVFTRPSRVLCLALKSAFKRLFVERFQHRGNVKQNFLQNMIHN